MSRFQLARSNKCRDRCLCVPVREVKKTLQRAGPRREDIQVKCRERRPRRNAAGSWENLAARLSVVAALVPCDLCLLPPVTCLVAATACLPGEEGGRPQGFLGAYRGLQRASVTAANARDATGVQGSRLRVGPELFVQWPPLRVKLGCYSANEHF